MYFESSGAYTGEISAEMLRHLFCKFVIKLHDALQQFCFIFRLAGWPVWWLARIQTLLRLLLVAGNIFQDFLKRLQ